ncbi:MAG TPA: carboxypeptidase-like regulatory domain-containing protein [Planctomicrobium sp.]|nr:carboxypeptidase-like regulatory domain-containing protein [Planctomicrobium sp.]
MFHFTLARNFLTLFVIVGALLLAAAGCRGKQPDRRETQLVPVQGTITMKGKPVVGAVVSFIVEISSSGGEPAYGLTDPEGKYVLKTSLPGSKKGMLPGAMPGDYKVTVTKTASQGFDSSDERVEEDRPQQRQLLPPKYSSTGQTPLQASVNSNSATFDFEL